MIIYNVTVKVAPEVNAEWLNWMRKEHIPEVMKTGLFMDHRIFRLLDQAETDGVTYAIQYTCNTIRDYELYARDHAPRLQQNHHARYPNNVAFRTILELI